ncbi:hypothetical protein [Oceanicaulis sp.]|uniref:hypothetical protein n=1 Tax=Oceanicaulis sp. TaxID=1924941 RepID=UPI003F703843
MSEVREAISVSGLPQEEGTQALYFHVGRGYMRTIDGAWREAGIVTRITVSADLPGLYCSLERVRVFDGETCIFEGPLHNLEGVEYAHPEKPEGQS